MYIAIDFDGTIVEDKWPKLGRFVPFAKETILRFKQDGHTLILNTCREGELLREAIAKLSENGLEFDFINDNPEARSKWGDCRKAYADMYIDDHNAFIRKTEDGSVDWLWILRQYNNLGGSDVVRKPSHYQGKGGLQAIDVIECFGLDYNLGNSEKYILRAGKKDGNSKVQDLKKAMFYIEREIQSIQQESQWKTA